MGLKNKRTIHSYKLPDQGFIIDDNPYMSHATCRGTLRETIFVSQEFIVIMAEEKKKVSQQPRLTLKTSVVRLWIGKVQTDSWENPLRQLARSDYLKSVSDVTHLVIDLI